MPRRYYPTNRWLRNFIVQGKKSRSAITLHVLKPLAGPCPDGSKTMQVGDGELLLKAQFAAGSFEKLEDSEDEETWERSLILVKDWDMHLFLKESKEKSEYIIHIKRFVVWYDEKKLSLKNSMIPCESHPEIRETIAQIWDKNHASKQSVTDPLTEDSDRSVSSIPLSILLEQIERADDKPSSDEQSLHKIPNAGPSESHPQIQETIAQIPDENHASKQSVTDPLTEGSDRSVSSIPLSILLEQIERADDKPSSDEQSFNKIPNAGSICSVSVENLQKNFEAENIQDFIISPKDVELHEAIVEWQKGYCVPENPSVKSGSEKPVSALAGTSTLKDQCKSSKVSQDAIIVPPPSIDRPEHLRQNSEDEEEENRLFRLSSVSNEQEKCSSIKELEKSTRNDAKNKIVPCPGTNEETVSASGASNASQLNKDSAETSSEIPLSGKVASNYNASKSTPDDLHCSLLDSSLDTSSEQPLARWNNLDLSSIESEKQFESAPCALKGQREETQISNKKIKLTHASGSTCDPRSTDSQGSLLNQPCAELNKKNSSSKSPTSLVELNKSVSQVDPTNKVSPANSKKHISAPDCLVEATLSPTKNVLTNNNGSSDHLCEEEEAQPIQMYATTQELFPKHSACVSLLPSNQQLTKQNNLNNIRLPKETMETINTYWSLSHNNLLWQRP